MSVPQIFKRNGYLYEEVKRRDNIAIFSQRHKNGHIVAYEVVKLRKKQTRYTDNEPLLMYPSSSEFGIYGYTFIHLENAEKKFEELTKK